jgi:LuxR family maltose regulon positive regulatory protein
VVCRTRLLERLDEGLQRRLTLIAAPAGFGKTTLVSEWLAGCSQPGRPGLCAAWLSLDEGDREPARFLSYLVAALQTVGLCQASGARLGDSVLAALQGPQPPIEPVLTALLNEITTINGHFVLILDDYHRVDSREVDAALTFLLDHLPPHMHLVITTREDPQLPLARLRARGQLCELRASDLRFTPAEAADLFTQMMGLNLAGADIAALEARTEGWIAGLQLAALALQETLASKGQAGVPAFIQAFAGDHRYIVDYLVEEVLQSQPTALRSFFLQTAILERLTGALCDAVTGQEGGSARLEALRRGNFFVVPLDDQRHWYRYHHLFAEVLAVHLLEQQPEQVAGLHRRASAWYARSGLTADAIHHALLGQDFERAAELIERAVPEMRRTRQEAALLGWLRALPEDLLRAWPVLNDTYAGALMQSGVMEGVPARLRNAERWLAPADRIDPPDQADLADQADLLELANPQQPTRSPGYVDEEEFRRLPASIAVHRAGYALIHGDVAGTIRCAHRALELLMAEDHLGGGAAASLLGLAFWARGELEAAQASYADGMARLVKAGHLSDTIGLCISLADIQLAQGQLGAALHTYERGWQLAAPENAPLLRGAADMLVGMSEIQRERNDLPAAARTLQRSQELGELKGLYQNPYRWRVAQARIQAAQGDLDGALDLLNEAEHRYMSDFSPNVHPVTATRTRV